MGTGYVRNDTANNIADGNIINAADFDGEYDAIEAAFNASTGHTHDGTSAEGAPIEVVGPSQDVVITASAIRPKTTNTVDLGTSSLEFKDAYFDGTVTADSVNITSGLTIDTINLTSTDAGAAKGPQLDIFRDSASPADSDVLGHIDFSGKDSGDNKTIYASILAEAADVTDTTEDGVLKINTMVAGADTTITTINADGLSVTTGNINLTSTDAGATKGPQLDLFRDSASPADNDVLGHIDFSGDDDGGNKTIYASILAEAADVTDGTEDGVMKFNTMVAGSDTTVVTVNADGIDVTGTITADGLTVSGDAVFTPDNDGVRITGANYATLRLEENDTTDLNTTMFNSGGDFSLYTSNDARSSLTQRLNIDHSTGDISFYEDTGTTAKLFWDASAENLGIGTSNPFTTLEVESAGASLAGLTSHMEISHNSLSANTGGALVLSSNNNRHGGIKGGSDSGGGTGYLSFYTRPSSGDLSERMRIDSSGNVGIGTSSPSSYFSGATDLVLSGSGDSGVTIASGTSGAGRIHFADGTSGDAEYRGYIVYAHSNDSLQIATAATERMRIDSSGNLLVGTTNTSVANQTGTTQGVRIAGADNIQAASTGVAAYFNKLSTDGAIVEFRKSGVAVGSIGVLSSRMALGNGGVGLFFDNISSDAIEPHSMSTNAVRTDAISLGAVGSRFKDLYLSGGAYIGGTGAANYLDDYEEGTYTVTATTSGSGTLTVDPLYNEYSYTKIGRLVTVTGSIDISATSSPTGYIKLSLPFTGASGSKNNRRASGEVTVYNVSSANISDFKILYVQGESTFRIYLGDATSIQGDSAQQMLGTTVIACTFSYLTE